MREILFRGKRIDNDEWMEGIYYHQTEFYGDICNKCYIISSKDELEDNMMIFYEVIPKTVGQFTGLYDLNGKMIFENDILKFNDEDGIWTAPVVFERGLFGLDVYRVKQIKNPASWNKEYDRVASRGWGCKWGYEERGTAFTSREPLSRATVFKGTPTEYQNSDIRKWHTRHGFDKYVMSAEVIGNIHDNPELLS